MRTPALWLRLAALSGLLSVAAGAFAAHGLNDPLAKEWMRTGSSWQAVHALATLACLTLFGPSAARARPVAPLFLAGSLLFSGSLYAMALGAPRLVAIVTPVGGLLFLAGWTALAWAAPQARIAAPAA